jgi:hypothetical protein
MTEFTINVSEVEELQMTSSLIELEQILTDLLLQALLPIQNQVVF